MTETGRRFRYGDEALSAESPEVLRFLEAWHENGRDSFEKVYKSLDYDSPAERKHATTRKRWVALDHGTSGAFLLDRATGDLWTIKAYGVPKRRVGTIEEVTAQYQEATAATRSFGYR